MRDFEDDLRDALSRKAAEAPQGGRVPEGMLRRARRRRMANGALAGAVAVALGFGGVIGVRAAMDMAGGGDVGPVPGASPEIGPSPTTSPPPDYETDERPVPAPRISPSTAPPAIDARCGRTEGGSDEVFPDFVAVTTDYEVEVTDSPESVTFRFEPMEGETDAPWHIIAYTDQLVTDGEGAPVDVEGDAFVVVTFMARGVDVSGEEIVPIYTGEDRIVPRGATLITEIVKTGDFEGMVSWGIGLSEKTCYTVDAAPDHLTVTFFP